MKKEGGVILFLIFLPAVVYGVYTGFQLPTKEYSSISVYLGNSWSTLYGHLGEDFIIPANKKVYASSDGIVEKAIQWDLCTETKVIDGKRKKIKDSHGWGGVVIIKHNSLQDHFFDATGAFLSEEMNDGPTQVYSQYGHLKNLQVTEGQFVKKGDYIGDIAKLCAWVEHLHLEIKDQHSIENEILDGVGKGYSGTDGHAPHRYKPSKFIELNKSIQPESVPESSSSQIAPKNQATQQTFWEKVKSFFSDFFSPDTQDVSTKEQTTVEAETEESVDEIENETVDSVYDVLFLPKNISLAITSDQTDATVLVFAKNTGNTTWQKNNTSLNVVGGPGPNQQFYHPTWMTQLRPSAMIESSVAPGEIGSFAFNMSLPENISDVFRLQLVKQSGSTFSQVGASLVNISFVHEEKPKVETEQLIDSEENEETFFQQLEDIQDVLGEKIGEVFEKIVKVVPHFLPFGGSGASDTSATETDIEEDEPTVQEVSPSLSITSPTSTLIFTTIPTTTITGIYNESVSSIRVNGAEYSVMASGTWTYDAVFVEDTTTTFSFVGWNADNTASSTEVSVSFIYTQEIVLPEITITSPSTTLYTATTTPIVVAGTFNTTTSYLTVNNATSTAFTMNTSTGEWGISVLDIEEHVTTTYTFVGWSAEGVSSTAAIIDILYEPEEIVVFAAPTILFPTASSTYTTTTIEFAVAGTAPTGTASLVLDLLGTTTSIDIVDNQWSVNVHYPGTGVYDFSIYGVDEYGQNSATSTITMSLVRELNHKNGALALSEIAWMGTEASANDEWFEIMFEPSGEGGVESSEETEDVYIVWGDYDTGLGTYDHSVTLNQSVIDAWSQAGPPIQIFDEPGFLVPLHPQFVFERTDQTTLSNANGIVYTGGFDNSGERVLVLTESGIILDDVNMSSGWEAGDNDTKEVMIRTDLYASSWCTYSTCSESEYIGTQIITDADGNLVNGSPYSPYQLLIPEF